jgi:hypothetical protein
MSLTMNKGEIEIELNKILNEVMILQSQAILQNQTTDFLGKETDKLILKSKNEFLSLEERETLAKQIESLQRRLKIEMDALMKDMSRLRELTNSLNYYQELLEKE